MVHIDLDHPRVSRTEGELFFQEYGGNTRIPGPHEPACSRPSTRVWRRRSPSSRRSTSTACSNPLCSTSSFATARNIASRGFYTDSGRAARRSSTADCARQSFTRSGYLQAIFMVIASLVALPRPHRAAPSKLRCRRAANIIEEVAGVDPRVAAGLGAAVDAAARAARPGRGLAAGQAGSRDPGKPRSTIYCSFYREATVVAMLGRARHRRPLLLQRRPHRLQLPGGARSSSTPCSTEIAASSHGRSEAAFALRGLDDDRHRVAGLPRRRTISNFGARDPLASIWIGNRTRIAAHHDLPDNLACVAVGASALHAVSARSSSPTCTSVRSISRRPARPISLVDFAHPGFREVPALRGGVAGMRTSRSSAPGDAHLHSRACGGITSSRSTPFNVLVNYWWRQSPAYMDTPMNALILAIMTVRDLPPRAARRLGSTCSTTTCSTPDRENRRAHSGRARVACSAPFDADARARAARAPAAATESMTNDR